MTFPLLRVALVAALLNPVLAMAQPAGTTMLPPPPDVQRLLGPNYSQPAVQSCPKLCPNDNSPCDPIYMKDADGRCDGVYGTIN